MTMGEECRASAHARPASVGLTVDVAEDKVETNQDSSTDGEPRAEVDDSASTVSDQPCGNEEERSAVIDMLASAVPTVPNTETSSNTSAPMNLLDFPALPTAGRVPAVTLAFARAKALSQSARGDRGYEGNRDKDGKGDDSGAGVEPGKTEDGYSRGHHGKGGKSGKGRVKGNGGKDRRSGESCSHGNRDTGGKAGTARFQPEAVDGERSTTVTVPTHKRSDTTPAMIDSSEKHFPALPAAGQVPAVTLAAVKARAMATSPFQQPVCTDNPNISTEIHGQPCPDAMRPARTGIAREKAAAFAQVVRKAPQPAKMCVVATRAAWEGPKTQQASKSEGRSRAAYELTVEANAFPKHHAQVTPEQADAVDTLCDVALKCLAGDVVSVLQMNACSQQALRSAAKVWLQWQDIPLFPRGDLEFVIQKPLTYTVSQPTRSHLCVAGDWKFKLLVFPGGTKTNGGKGPAAFVLADEEGLGPDWVFPSVIYSITMVNKTNSHKSVTKKELHTFAAAVREGIEGGVDRGWHSDWVSKCDLKKGTGWLDEQGSLTVRACCVPWANSPWALALQGLTVALEAGAVPAARLEQLVKLREKITGPGVPSHTGNRLLRALTNRLCPRCSMRPPTATSCVTCVGSGTARCNACQGRGHQFLGGRRGASAKGDGHGSVTCRSCQGRGMQHCRLCVLGRPCCAHCQGKGAGKPQQQWRFGCPSSSPPAPGVSVKPCGVGEFSTLKELWSERGGHGQLLAAWSVDNPLLAWHYATRRRDLQQAMGREADELQGFHGSHPDNLLPICTSGFDDGLRSGQVFGSGEYFAKCPTVSESYCRGGEYMLVCRLSLGVASSTRDNKDGDHIWVPEQAYYVISRPHQILPAFIVQFSTASKPPTRSTELLRVLSLPSWSTKLEVAREPVPANRPCHMSMKSTNSLWLGYLHAHLPDEQLEEDVRNFLAAKAGVEKGVHVQIVCGRYKKAHVQLTEEFSREKVHRLNRENFTEAGMQRTICVEDAHGSPGQRCPRWIASYCRGHNLRFTHPCWCQHPPRPTESAHFELVPILLDSAKGNDIATRFERSAPFHDGIPRIVAIHAVENAVLSKLHEEYRDYLRQKNREEPAARELYHGTNNNILDVVYKHGLQPPSDFQASDRCPVSGGKGLCTSLCSNSCKYCTTRHVWNSCHMYGLGVYAADMASKSHRYCSRPEEGSDGRRRYRMVVCEVLGRALELAGHLRERSAMHDVPNVRFLADKLEQMMEPHADGAVNDAPVEHHDLLFVKGLGDENRCGLSVVNNEYIAFHPHQCLPRYQITYDI